jgi:uncharacterized protein (TIGR02266 family)
VIIRDVDLDETDALLSNLSMGGAFIKTDQPLEIGDTVAVELRISPDEAPVCAEGKVSWRRPLERALEEGQTAGMGVQFTRIHPFDLARLKRFIEAKITEDLFGTGHSQRNYL